MVSKIISIVIPVYNVEKWLSQCLDSCVTQDIPADEYEIICVNDGSTDSSGHILEEYARNFPQITVIQKENGGVSSARNVGIRKAVGSYIWFVDSDDLIHCNCLRSIAAVLHQENPDLLFIKPMSFEDGSETPSMLTDAIPGTSATALYEKWLWTRIYRKDCITQNQVWFNEKITLAEDNLFCSVLQHYIKNTAFMDSYVLYFYRHRENSLCTSPTKGKINKMIQSCVAFRDIKQQYPDLTSNADSLIYEFMVTIMSNLAHMRAKAAKPYISILKKEHLYPLPKQNILPQSEPTSGHDDRVLYRLRMISYTRFGYMSLRTFRLWLRIKRRL